MADRDQRVEQEEVEESAHLHQLEHVQLASRPATTTISIKASQPAIHIAANGLEGVRSIYEGCATRS